MTSECILEWNYTPKNKKKNKARSNVGVLTLIDALLVVDAVK